MAKIYNSDCTKGLARNAAIQQNVDKTPNELADKIVPTFETNPQLLRYTNYIVYGAKSLTGDLTLETTSTTKDTYLTGINLAFSKDAACNCDTGACSLQVTPDETNVKTTIFHIVTPTLTADARQASITFRNPIKLKRGTTIILGSNGFTAGNYERRAQVYGYTIDNPNA
jgi:hypothetical protein